MITQSLSARLNRRVAPVSLLPSEDSLSLPKLLTNTQRRSFDQHRPALALSLFEILLSIGIYPAMPSGH
jgi:hypothetical protein